MLYDPLTYDNLMMGLVVQFQKQPQHSLSEAASIEGPGKDRASTRSTTRARCPPTPP